MPTQLDYAIPKIRHVTGPCWKSKLGDKLVEAITDLHERSAKHGWFCRYWSHAAMDAEMRRCDKAELVEAYFSIDPDYYAARSDLFRVYLLWKYGGLWLDLRGVPSEDEEKIGLETIFRKVGGKPPPLLLERCGGFHKEKFGGEFGQICNGWMMSAPKLDIWRHVLQRAIRMIGDYHERCSVDGEGNLADNTLRYYSTPVQMTGREGVLCLGPLAATPVLQKYLGARDALEQTMPKEAQGLFAWNTIHAKRRTWAEQQGSIFFRDDREAAKHQHYSRLRKPIVLSPSETNAASAATTCASTSSTPTASSTAALSTWGSSSSAIAAPIGLPAPSAFVSLGESRLGRDGGAPVLHISDSVLCHQTSAKLDNSWLGVAADVYRGRTFMKHDWTGDVVEKRVALHYAGNDFKTDKGRVKGDWPWNFSQVVRAKLAQLKNMAEEVVVVVWGDWQLWKEGFYGAVEADGVRFDQMMASVGDCARDEGIRCIWLRESDLRHLETTSDYWHFAASSGHDLREIVQGVFNAPA